MLYILKGSFNTFLISLFSVSFGITFGFYFNYFSFFLNKLNLLKKIYISLWRGSPLIFQLNFFYFVLGKYLKFSSLFWGCITIGLNSGAYFSAIFDDFFNTINTKYGETAQSLGISKKQFITQILLPNIFLDGRSILIGEINSVIKETSIVSIIGVSEIFMRAKEVATYSYNFLPPIFFSGLIFYIINIVNEFFLSKHILNFFAYLVQNY